MRKEPQASAASLDRAVIGGSAWKGIGRVLQSRYLSGISLYVLLLTVVATFIYFTRLQMVAALGEDTDMRATVLAQIDLITQMSTLVLQLLVTGHLMKRFGVGVALAVLPVVASLGFIGLAMVASFAALIVLDAFTARFNAPSPARRAKRCSPWSAAKTSTSPRRSPIRSCTGAAISLGAWTEGWLGQLGLGLIGLAAAVVPLAAGWAVLGLWLGRRQDSMQADRTSEPASAPARTLTSPVA